MIKPPLHSLSDWAQRHPLARKAPAFLTIAAEREHAAATFRPDDQTHKGLVNDIGRDILRDFNQGRNSYATRRKVHGLVENYLKENQLYPQLQDRMHGCRCHGAWGHRPTQDGDVTRVIGWDHKCGLVRLCPDEARTEQARIARRYVQPIMDWRSRSRLRRLQQCVLTNPKIDPEDLHYYKRELMDRAAKWIKKFPAIKGAILCQEDPLAADERFHVHHNYVLLVDGFFNWQHARLEWYEMTKDLFPDQSEKMKKGWNIYFKDITDQEDLHRAVNELVKYPVKFVSDEMLDPEREKSKKKKSPPLTEWPADVFTAWWEAGFGDWKQNKKGKFYRPVFRRTRSFGVLLSIESFYWNEILTYHQKAHLLAICKLDPLLAAKRWRQLPIDKETRAELKAALDLQPNKTQGDTTWCGKIRFDRASGTYALTHIMYTEADKSGGQGGRSGNSKPYQGQDPPICNPPGSLSRLQQQINE